MQIIKNVHMVMLTPPAAVLEVSCNIYRVLGYNAVTVLFKEGK